MRKNIFRAPVASLLCGALCLLSTACFAALGPGRRIQLYAFDGEKFVFVSDSVNGKEEVAVLLNGVITYAKCVINGRLYIADGRLSSSCF